MPINVKCPEGHKAKVPEKFAGKTLKCPTCRTPFRVPAAEAAPEKSPPREKRPASQKPVSPKPVETVAQSNPNGNGDQSSLQLTSKSVVYVAVAWSASMLLAVLVGAFVSRSLGPPIEVKSDPPVMMTATGDSNAGVPLSSDDQPDTFGGSPIKSGGAPGTDKGASVNTQTASGQTQPLQQTPVSIVPEAGSGVGAVAYANNRTPSSRDRARAQQQAISAQLAESHGSGNSMQMNQAQAEAALKADLQEAVSMLDKKQFRLLIADFLPPQQIRSISRNSSRTQTLSDRESADLKAHLQAAMGGQFGFNRNYTLVEIHYVKQPVTLIPPGPPQYIPSTDDRPAGRVSGLGSNLATALKSAVTLLEGDKLQEFIRSAYPLAEVAKLSEADFMDRMVARISENPDMKQAMIRDLNSAAGAQPQISGNEAQVKLPPLVPGDPDRILKFQLVDDNWRFYDGRSETRTKYRELVSADVPAVTIPGSRGTVMLVRSGENWRLSGAPTTEPLN